MEEDKLNSLIYTLQIHHIDSEPIENLIEGYKEHRNALIDMVNQFADTDKEEKHLYTMGLSALENAFNVLDIDEGIKREDLWKLQEGDDK